MRVNEQLINQKQIRKAIHMLIGDGNLFEVRIIPTGKQGKPSSGYFKSADTLIKAFDEMKLWKTNVYIVLNQIDDALYSREQRDRFIQGATSTSDNDITELHWLMIDFDPKRVSGVSSTKEEHEAAEALADTVAKYLTQQGWPEPIVADSGNGAHLLYKIRLFNNEENKTILEKCLKVLDAMFSNEKVEVDTTTFNPSRICKLYGTMAQKGSNSEDRPHRMSFIYNEDKPTSNVPKAMLSALAENDFTYKEPEAPAKYNNYSPQEFDIKDWLTRNGLTYTKAPYRDGDKYVLDECPFDHNHKKPDSAVYRLNSGAIGFKCSHNSCSGYHWKDLRTLFEPDAYVKNKADERIQSGWNQHNRNKDTAESVPLAGDKPEAPPVPENRFLTLKEIASKPDVPREFIKTGFYKLDVKTNGLEKGKVTLVTGLRASGKSTFLGQVILNAINAGHRCIVYSGELNDRMMLNWVLLQAAGRNHITKAVNYNFYTPEEAAKTKIIEWIGDNYILYNNDYGHNWELLEMSLRAKLATSKADMVVLDNLMTLDIAALNTNDKYEAQTEFVKRLTRLAKEFNTHVLIVAHPRKPSGLLRLDDVSGTGNLSNHCDNAIIVHRINDDFKRLSKQTLGWKDSNDIFKDGYQNAIEVVKDRESGTQDFWVGLYFEEKSKRLLNNLYEYKAYGWDDGSLDGFTPADDINF